MTIVIGAAPRRRLPDDIAIVILGRSAAPLARRLQAVLGGADVHGPRTERGDWDIRYDRASAHIVQLFAAGRPIVGICASGILIRSVAPMLAAKRQEPPVVAVAEDGSVAIPLLGGHHGANAIAQAVTGVTGGSAAITTAGDLRLGLALDEPPPGWRIADPERVKPVAAALLAGEPVALIEEAGGGDWLRSGNVAWSEDAVAKVVVTDREPVSGATALVYHPPVLALGIGCERGCSPDEIADLARVAMAEAGLAAGAVGVVVSIELKLAEPGIHQLARGLGVPARFFSGERLLEETGRLTERSQAAYRVTGCWGVAEGAALAAVGHEGTLVVPKRKSRHATCAVARAPLPFDVAALGRPRGHLAVIGIGPGDPAWRTPEASAALAAASDVVGYRLYLDLIGPVIAGKRRHDGVLGEEEARVQLALDLAAGGRNVALVSSGDAGIYGLAALVFEVLERRARPDWRSVEIAVCPGVSAMQAAAARAGAPLGHDFCAISLSDLLIPWAAIHIRLEAAAAGDFVVALYNPRSTRRSGQLAEAARILLCHRTPQTPVFVARNLGRDGERTRIIPLSDLTAVSAEIDMLSLVIIGNSTTRMVPGDPPRLYTPRGYFHDAEP
jgi:cobalt-precorrin 5A hydrolase / precorrin-3B C17-methyltransferase